MNTKTIIILSVLGLVAFVLYYFTNKANTTVTVDQKNTNTTTGLSALLNTQGGGSVISNLFQLGAKPQAPTNTAPMTKTDAENYNRNMILGIGGLPI